MIRKTFLAILYGWLILSCSDLYGQQVSLLRDIWSETEKNYSGVLASRSAVESSQINETVVKSNALPQIKTQLQNTYGTFEGSNGASFPQQGFFTVSGSRVSSDGSALSANTFVSMVTEYEIYNFGRQQADQNAASLLTSKAKSNQSAYLIRLQKTVFEKYVDAVFAVSKLRLADKNKSRIQKIHAINSALSRSGLRPQADSVLTYSSYLQASAVSYNLNGMLLSTTEKLKEFYPKEIDTAKLESAHFLEPIPLSGFELSLNTTHPLTKTLEFESAYFQKKAEIQRKASLPSIKALAGYAYRGSGINSQGYSSGNWIEGFSNPANNFLIGLGVTWNITSVYTNGKRADAFRKESHRFAYLEEQSKTAIQIETSALQKTISAQFDELGKQAEAVKKAESAYEMYFARYKSGLIGLTELLQIQQIVETAENNQLNAVKEYWKQVINLAEMTTDFDYLFNNL